LKPPAFRPARDLTKHGESAPLGTPSHFNYGSGEEGFVGVWILQLLEAITVVVGEDILVAKRGGMSPRPGARAPFLIPLRRLLSQRKAARGKGA
jgi:hypothetical protein